MLQHVQYLLLVSDVYRYIYIITLLSYFVIKLIKIDITLSAL